MSGVTRLTPREVRVALSVVADTSLDLYDEPEVNALIRKLRAADARGDSLKVSRR